MAHENFMRDPAIDRFNAHREGVYKTFRWTRGTVTSAVLGFVVAPGLLYYVACKTDGRWNWNGKRKGESLLANP